MTVIEAYQKSYQAKNKAVQKKLSQKVATLTDEKKRLKRAGEDELRKAYAEHMRLDVVTDQQSREAGRFGGAAENVRQGRASEHRLVQAERRAALEDKVAAVDGDIAAARASAEKSIANNNRAVQLKKDLALAKEEQAAQKKAAGSGGSGNKGGKALTKSQVISLLRMGIYDSSFAAILGVAEEELENYLNGGEEKKDGGTKLPGTYKPALQ